MVKKNIADVAIKNKKILVRVDFNVNDAFGAAHRAHASTAGGASHLPAVAGFLIEKEIEVPEQSLKAPDHPFAAIFGGGMANTFLSHRIFRWNCPR